jgi:hypothetical protein
MRINSTVIRAITVTILLILARQIWFYAALDVM